MPWSQSLRSCTFLDVDFDWYLNDLSNPETGPHTPDSPEASAESGTSDSQSLASIIDGGSASFELPLPEDQPTSRYVQSLR